MLNIECRLLGDNISKSYADKLVFSQSFINLQTLQIHGRSNREKSKNEHGGTTEWFYFSPIYFVYTLEHLERCMRTNNIDRDSVVQLTVKKYGDKQMN